MVPFMEISACDKRVIVVPSLGNQTDNNNRPDIYQAQD